MDDTLRDAFVELRALNDDDFLSHPNDCKLHAMIDTEDDLTGCWCVFSALFAALKREGFARLSKDYPDLIAAHDQQNFKMRLLRYPATQSTTVRGKEHTDYGTFSLIFADAAGLEVEKGGEWVEASADETNPAVVVGSSMKLLADPSATPTNHRVSGNSLRHSIVLFIEANDDFAFRDGQTMKEYIKRRSGTGVTVEEE